MTSKVRYARYKAAGKCISCPATAVNHGVRCMDCSIKDREVHRRIYRNRRAQGLCTKCGKREATTEAYCEHCLIDKWKWSY